MKKSDCNLQKQTDKAVSFTKKLIVFIILMSELEIIASYTLAFLGMPDIASTLSEQVVRTVLGGIAFYFIKSLVENLSKYGGLFGGNPKLILTTNNDDKATLGEPYDIDESSTTETADAFWDATSVQFENNVGIDD